jgi:hypothetical protein
MASNSDSKNLEPFAVRNSNDDSHEDAEAKTKITCTSSDCENNLHCFRPTRRMKNEGKEGLCRTCGAQLFDWETIHEKSIDNLEQVINALKYEQFRHHYWHLTIDEKAAKNATKISLEELAERVARRFKSSLKLNNPYDGRQTPLTGNILYYAQHATATCCRKCIEYWHDIPLDHELSDRDIEYFTALAMRYIEEKILEIKEIYGE